MKTWIRALRVYSFPTSLIPVFLGAFLGGPLELPREGIVLFFIITAMLCIHGGTNLINDYEDYNKGLDDAEHPGASGLMADNILTPTQVQKTAYILFGAAFICALPLFYIGGLPILILGITGILGGYFYTAPPFAYKYRAAGDFFVFFLMGIAPVAGTLLLITGEILPVHILHALPTAFLVTAILHANNIRDAQHDSECGVSTVAYILGENKSRVVFGSEVLAAYGVVLLTAWIHSAPILLLPFISIFSALQLIRKIQKSMHNQALIQYIDKDVAQLYTVFGLLYGTGLYFYF
ncbi:MAG: prenyltransferase [Fibrobacterota bacterium]